MREPAKKFVIKEATKKRCKIIEANESSLKRFVPICLELFDYLKEAKSINFSLFFRTGTEIIEFIKPTELSKELLDQMWIASTKPAAQVEIYLLKADYPNFEATIDQIRSKKIRAVLEKDRTLDQAIIEVYSTLSSASQMIVRGGITGNVANRAMSATAALMSSQIDSEVAVGTLSRMINCDTTLYDHSASVAMIAGVIAGGFLKTPLKQQEAEAVAQCGLYHDAGKSCIPNHILNKPGVFTPEEYEVMKTHTHHGHDELCRAIDRGAPINDLAARVALEHHERFTGKGYPNKRKGRFEESLNGIHLYSRIVSIADVYSALLMKRVYKESLNSKDAISLMKKVAADDFDPEIFDPFYKHVMSSIDLFKGKEEEIKKSSVKMIGDKESFTQALKKGGKESFTQARKEGNKSKAS